MPQTSSPHPRAPRPADFPHHVAEIVRFGDLDAQGHVNNAVYSTYLESGRVMLFRDPDLGIGFPNATFVLVRQEIDFLRELRWPDNITVGTALDEFGRTSFKVRQAIFRGEECVAASRATLVMLDTETRRARALPPEAKARLSQWQYRGA